MLVRTEDLVAGVLAEAPAAVPVAVPVEAVAGINWRINYQKYKPSSALQEATQINQHFKMKLDERNI